MNILANDGISPAGLAALEAAGHRVWTDFVPAEALAEFINSENVDGLLVRSATKVREPLIDACPNLKFIIRAGRYGQHRRCVRTVERRAGQQHARS